MPSAPEATPVRLPLSSSETWTAHHVLLDRIESERRSPATTDPPPIEVFRAFEKIEAGDSWFTPPELRCLRAELRRYLGAVDTPPDRATAERVIDRITDALAGRSRRRGGRPSRQSVSPGRRTRPR